ncbi:sulfotransferase [Sulfurimonas sp. HSL1-6]|uniref:sulfotransferase family protein n=1 Tax=Thiomicrolovo immobilis TaxID=3131935 RepID=UPI0031F9637F
MVVEGREMIFVVGNSRSGTTMMGRILGRNKDVFTFGELHFYGMMYDPAKEKNAKLSFDDSVQLFSRLLCLQREGFFSECSSLESYYDEVNSVLDQTIEYRNEEIYEIFALYETQKQHKTIPCEQTPKNLFFLEDILKLPLDARIINMVRDPRDVLNSQKNKWKRRFLGAKQIPIREAVRAWFNYHPITIALVWKAAVNEYKKQARQRTERLMLVHFEELLLNPESELKRICEFLSITYDLKMLDVPQVGSSDGNDSEEKGINKKRLNPWKHSKSLKKTEIYLCEKYCGKEMKAMGYELSNVRPNLLLLMIYYLSFPIKMGMALLLNVKRMKNMMATIKTYLAKD